MLRALKLKSIRITDPFFGKRIQNAKEVAIPYMWSALNDQIPGVPESGGISNFEVAAGRKAGAHKGFVFQDSDVWKWIEGCAYLLETQPDEALEKKIDDFVQLAEEAQQADGYLDTYYILNPEEKKFSNLRDNHELYIAGHMFEAACAYYSATGKGKIVELAKKVADCIDARLGEEEGKLKGYPGHPEIEIGLAKLYKLTGEERYLKLAKFFVDERGKQPCYYDIEAEARGEAKKKWQWQWSGYYQAHMPVREQFEGTGHSVRQCYLLAGMTDIGALTGDDTLIEAAERVYRNIVNRQMYITAGVGATHVGEAFTFDFDLPPERCYTETCACISLIMTAVRLNRVKPNGAYGDIVERGLYNGILSGISLDGTKYFYMNPLEVWPERCERRNDMRIDDMRKGWFGCACCPPNILRTITGLGNYIASEDDNSIYIDQYITSEFETENAKIELFSGFPWSGNVQIRVAEGKDVALKLRMPGWAKSVGVRIGYTELVPEIADGYMTFDRTFNKNDLIDIEFPMDARFISATLRTPNYAGKVALTRGPVVYCLEEIDNDRELWRYKADTKAPVEVVPSPELLGGVMKLVCDGVKEFSSDTLYTDETPNEEKAKLTFVPYYAWNNRGRGEMSVWVRKL